MSRERGGLEMPHSGESTCGQGGANVIPKLSSCRLESLGLKQRLEPHMSKGANVTKEEKEVMKELEQLFEQLFQRIVVPRFDLIDKRLEYLVARLEPLGSIGYESTDLDAQVDQLKLNIPTASGRPANEA